MARKSAPVDPAQRDLLTAVGEEIVTRLDGKFFECDSPYKATVKYEDKTFKKKEIMAGWEFALTYAYVGVRGDLIFGFTPEDTQEYQFVEMTAKEIELNFPLFGPEIGKLFGIGSENFVVVLDSLVVRRVDEEVARKEKERIEAEQTYESLPSFGMF